MVKKSKIERGALLRVGVRSLSLLFLFLTFYFCLLPSASAQPRSVSPMYNPNPPDTTQPGKPAILREVGIDQRLNEQVPLDLEFRDEAGRSVRLGDYFGTKPVVLALVYFDCPMLCTQILNGTASGLRAVSFDPGKDFEVVAVSFDPRETPELAARKKVSYMDRYHRPGTEGGWHFLTGDEANIKRLTEAVGFRYKYDPETKQFAHASGITILTPQGKLARYFYGIEYAPNDLRLGLVEASENKIGTPVDQLMLYCYHYDPMTGKYGPVIMNIIRLAGGVTVIALFTLILLLMRRGNPRAGQLKAGGTA